MNRQQIDEVINSLTKKEKKALIEAISPIYFADRADYIRGLWAIVNVLIGDKINIDGVNLKDWLYALEPELYKEES